MSRQRHGDGEAGKEEKEGKVHISGCLRGATDSGEATELIIAFPSVSCHLI